MAARAGVDLYHAAVGRGDTVRVEEGLLVAVNHCEHPLFEHDGMVTRRARVAVIVFAFAFVFVPMRVAVLMVRVMVVNVPGPPLPSQGPKIDWYSPIRSC